MIPMLLIGASAVGWCKGLAAVFSCHWWSPVAAGSFWWLSPQLLVAIAPARLSLTRTWHQRMKQKLMVRGGSFHMHAFCLARCCGTCTTRLSATWLRCTYTVWLTWHAWVVHVHANVHGWRLSCMVSPTARVALWLHVDMAAAC